ncbi:hypothetical protein GU926_01955 [Nibribacter ruber]|uniref:Uncharacterized protein n=1 Tax=Nibribacter ruber TaxID=2698458 RepID=A0A6P1NVA6_9BACT|nr:hypothetical protein [Nibribacter ruber]QHL86274.1 hypothetical protein GU926_01955 [Nibribacter ruber]
MSATNAEPKEFYPLVTNILKLQYCSGFFDLTEIVMFDWFVVKAKAFKYKQFYYSRRRISEEIRVKEDRLTTIIARFHDLSFIGIEIKGMPRQHYFTVDLAKVIELIPQIFQFTENSKLSPEYSKLLAYFSKLLAESSTQKKYNKEAYKEGIQGQLREEENMVGDGSPTGDFPFSDGEELNTPKDFCALVIDRANQATERKRLEAQQKAERKAQKEAELVEQAKQRKVDSLIRLLNNTYASRVNMHKEGKTKGERVKSITKLSFLKRNKDALYELAKEYGDEEIENSFIAYIDEFLKEDIEVRKLIPYFLARKPETRDFDTFHTYLNKFIAEYSYEKS